MGLRIFLTGQKHFGAEVFEAVRKDGHQVLAVASPPFANEKLLPQYASPDERWDRLRATAERRGIPWISSASGISAALVPTGTDVIVAAHSHWFVSKKAMARTALGGFGYHPSLLPLHRGRSAVEWTIRMRDRVAGGSCYWLTDSVDGGPIAAQDWCFVHPKDTAKDLWRRDLSPMGVRLIRKVLADLAAGVVVRVPQDEAFATWEPSLEAQPIHRPDRPELGAGLAGRRVVADRDEARAFGLAQCRAAMYGIELEPPLSGVSVTEGMD